MPRRTEVDLKYLSHESRLKTYDNYVTDRCEIYSEVAKVLKIVEDLELRREIEILKSLGSKSN